jgi:hypothetical protein
MKRLLLAFAGLVGVVFIPVVAHAHNAGHLFLPDGRCMQVGSFKEAPIVGPDGEQLDLVVVTLQDEFGVSFVGVIRDTPIFPGRCPTSSPPQNGGGR